MKTVLSKRVTNRKEGSTTTTTKRSYNCRKWRYNFVDSFMIHLFTRVIRGRMLWIFSRSTSLSREKRSSMRSRSNISRGNDHMTSHGSRTRAVIGWNVPDSWETRWGQTAAVFTSKCIRKSFRRPQQLIPDHNWYGGRRKSSEAS